MITLLTPLVALCASATVTPHYVFSPVKDGAVLSVSLGLGLLSEAIVGTGEIQPQAPGNPEKLLAIDRHYALTPSSTQGADGLANLALGVTVGWAIIDVALTALLENRRDHFWTTAGLYAESAAITVAVTNLTKIAVRRPRPRAYLGVAQGLPGATALRTDDALSFFSGHTAVTAAISATAVHMAFTRDPDGWVPWVILAGGVLATGIVGLERIASRDHFPTDVIAGALVGAGIGVLVPALHASF